MSRIVKNSVVCPENISFYDVEIFLLDFVSTRNNIWFVSSGGREGKWGPGLFFFIRGAVKKYCPYTWKRQEYNQMDTYHKYVIAVVYWSTSAKFSVNHPHCHCKAIGKWQNCLSAVPPNAISFLIVSGDGLLSICRQ